MTKQHLVIAVPAVRGRAIGENALARARILSEFYDVTVVSDSFPDVVPEEVQCLSVKPRRFDYLRRFCHVPNDLAFALSVRRALSNLQTRNPIDFLLCHGYTLTRFVGRYLNGRYGMRFGMFMHGHIFTRPRGTYDRRMTAFYRWMAPKCYREADLVFALSPEQMNLAIEAGAAKAKVVLAPNGIRLEDVGRSNDHSQTDEFGEGESDILKILYVGRLSVEKGVDTLLEACGLLTKWNIEYSLTVIGNGPCSGTFSDLAERTGITDRVKFVREVPREHLGAYYRAADTLCVPSLDEPLGNVVLEGLISGCLVVGSETGGIRFIISDGVNGYLVAPGKPLKWAEKLEFISRNKDHIVSLVENGRETAGTRFSWDSIVLDMHAAISRTLA